MKTITIDIVLGRPVKRKIGKFVILAILSSEPNWLCTREQNLINFWQCISSVEIVSIIGAPCKLLNGKRFNIPIANGKIIIARHQIYSEWLGRNQ